MSPSQLRNELTAQAIVKRFNHQRLPRLNELRDRVERGERLGEFDIRFLSEVLHDASQFHASANAAPAYKDLIVKAIELYHHITEKALENESRRSSTKSN
ncbi:hypothetical protein [Agaribacterium haliotis]|uniref:hypothetical protein n=1 Tax=Agaribacterium haliotis TaxID=2013869 RepID=UPI000BB56CB1|nr:hypothetical protein [Agaribacterium haliotis]